MHSILILYFNKIMTIPLPNGICLLACDNQGLLETAFVAPPHKL